MSVHLIYDATYLVAGAPQGSVETLYSTGMRRLELASLKLYDIDTERGTVMIRQGKGKKDRVIPIGERAAALLKTNGNREHAANLLGISLSHLNRLIRTFGP
jgi:site-specific recombinase XerC